MVICPRCGEPSREGAALCRRCLGRLDGAAPLIEAECQDDNARRAPRWFGASGSRWLRLGGIVLAVVAAALVGSRVLGIGRSAAPFEPPASSVRTLSDGPEVWSSPNGGTAGTRATTATPALAGREVWRVTLGRGAHSSLIAGAEAIYVGVGERELVAIDANDGSERWRSDMGGVMDAAPVLADDRLYVGLRDGRVLAIDTPAGSIAWTYAGPSPVEAPALVAAGVVYAVSNTDLLALNAETGALLGARGLGDRLALASPALERDRVAVATFERVLFFDRQSGAETFHLNRVFPGERASVAIESAHVYIVTRRGLVAFDRDVRLPWWERIRAAWDWANLVGIAPAVPWRAAVWAQPLEARALGVATGGGLVLVAWEGGRVVAFDAATGTRRWWSDVPDLASAPILTAAGVLVSVGAALILLDFRTGAEIDRRPVGDERVDDFIVTSHGTYYLTSAGDLVALR